MPELVIIWALKYFHFSFGKFVSMSGELLCSLRARRTKEVGNPKPMGASSGSFVFDCIFP